MPIKIVRKDITKMHVDAIVNAANPKLEGGGGVDGAIHKAAGLELYEACRALGGCKTGEAKITQGFNMACKYIIHTVGPVWQGGDAGEAELLAACYRNSLKLAVANGCKTVAFPIISAGAYGYPRPRAVKVALKAMGEFLLDTKEDILAYLVIYGDIALGVDAGRYWEIRDYIQEFKHKRYDPNDRLVFREDAEHHLAEKPDMVALNLSLRKDLKETFSHMLLRMIDESGMTDSECYKRANIDRKLFSKIRSDEHYKPSRNTVIAFTIALKLDLIGANELMNSAGFALSESSRFDLIIMYFIANHIYDIHEINAMLFDMGENSFIGSN